MSDAVPVEIAKQPTSKEQGKILQFPTTPANEHRKSIVKITDYLARANHPQPPEQVSAGAEADTALAKVEEVEGVGAKVINMGDWVKRQHEDLVGDFTGSNRIYTTEGKSGHEGVMRRMSKKVLAKVIPMKVTNILSIKNKEAA